MRHPSTRRPVAYTPGPGSSSSRRLGRLEVPPSCPACRRAAREFHELGFSSRTRWARGTKMPFREGTLLGTDPLPGEAALSRPGPIWSSELGQTTPSFGGGNQSRVRIKAKTWCFCCDAHSFPATCWPASPQPGEEDDEEQPPWQSPRSQICQRGRHHVGECRTVTKATTAF
ncbi:unnamed protein product [Protopolystoma xenopodis]|uniref:Uncharacterized protein n=1 Tax=Protopolystoma xenopodis TaxID=117903 RepID=A0A448WT94_9PLAT|nr:unnamed protein product [Protopolystoma xenopodis]